MRFIRQIHALVLSLFLLFVHPSWADTVEPKLDVHSVVLTKQDGHWDLQAEIQIILGDYLEDIATRGVPLYFVADIEIFRPRWYWVDKEVFRLSKTWRIQYQVLTHQWRVTVDGLAIPTQDLAQALSMIEHMRSWELSGLSLNSGTEHKGRFRIRLDASQLSRLFRVEALSNDEWSLSSQWVDFIIPNKPEGAVSDVSTGTVSDSPENPSSPPVVDKPSVPLENPS